MAYDDPQDDRDRIPPPPPLRNGYDDGMQEGEYGRRAYQPPQPSGWGCSKGCLYGMAGCGCLTMIVAVAAVALGWRFVNKAFSSDPAVVTATAKEIADFDLPPDFKPAVKIDFWFAKLVIFNNGANDSSLILTEVDSSKLPAGNGPPPNLEGNQQEGQRKLEIIKSELKELKIRGENTKVEFAEAKDRSNGNEYRVVKGSFRGKNGPAQFELQMPKDKYKEEAALKFLESIK